MAATAALVVTLTMCSTALLLGAAFNGEDIAEQAFGDLTKPTGAVSGLVFAWELLAGLGSVLIAILTADFGLPPTLRFIVATLCDTVLVVSIVGLFK